MITKKDLSGNQSKKQILKLKFPLRKLQKINHFKKKLNLDP